MLCEVPLTKEQQAFATAHHSLVYKFLNENRLPEDEFYDVVIFGYLKAVRDYFSDLTAQQFTFSTIANRRMKFCLFSKSRIDRDRNGREYVGRLGASAGAGWGACWPGAVLGLPFWGGVRSIYDFDCKTAGKRAQVLIFSPFLPSCSSSPSSDVLAFSCWLCLFDLGGQAGGIGGGGWRRVHLAGVLGVSCAPAV